MALKVVHYCEHAALGIWISVQLDRALFRTALSHLLSVTIKKKYFPYTVHIQYRVGQNISNFQRFHTVIRQALFYPKVPKLANFRRSLAEIEWCANFLALRSDKNKQDREQFFAVRFVCPSSSKHNFTVPLKKVLFLNFTPILYIFFANMSKRHLKN